MRERDIFPPMTKADAVGLIGEDFVSLSLLASYLCLFLEPANRWKQADDSTERIKSF